MMTTCRPLVRFNAPTRSACNGMIRVRPVFCCVTAIVPSLMCDHAICTTSERRCPVLRKSSNARRCFEPTGQRVRNVAISASLQERMRCNFGRLMPCDGSESAAFSECRAPHRADLHRAAKCLSRSAHAKDQRRCGAHDRPELSQVACSIPPYWRRAGRYSPRSAYRMRSTRRWYRAQGWTGAAVMRW